MLISTGMASDIEIGDALETAKSAGCKDVLLFHCISSYPAPIDQANLKSIKTLSEKFRVEVGLSDHTIGHSAALASVALGAVAIEKHFTLDRNDKGPDSDFSIEPSEFRELVKETKNVWKALGDGELSSAECEKQNLIFRRSLYFMKNLKAGQVIKNDDIRRIRPGFGLAPKHESEIIGSTLVQDVSVGDRVSFDVILSSPKNT
jgi:N-acetylneuraminate synthase